MSVMASHLIAIASERDIVVVRREVRKMAIAMGFGVTDVTRIVTAASELARNMFEYAGEGDVTCESTQREDDCSGLQLVFRDEGPGIEDVEAAMGVGYTTSGGLGLGLPGSKRLMDEMEIVSSPGVGTTITLRKWLRRY